MGPLVVDESCSNSYKTKISSCTKCNYSSSFKVHLKQHKAFKHTEMLYKCDKCDVTSSTRSYLMSHIKKMHLNIRRTLLGHAKVKAGKRRKCKETLEIKKSKCNICLCGGAKIFKRTNRETLDWLKLNSGLSQTELLIEV